MKWQTRCTLYLSPVTRRTPSSLHPTASTTFSETKRKQKPKCVYMWKCLHIENIRLYQKCVLCRVCVCVCVCVCVHGEGGRANGATSFSFMHSPNSIAVTSALAASALAVRWTVLSTTTQRDSGLARAKTLETSDYAQEEDRMRATWHRTTV